MQGLEAVGSLLLAKRLLHSGFQPWCIKRLNPRPLVNRAFMGWEGARGHTTQVALAGRPPRNALWQAQLMGKYNFLLAVDAWKSAFFIYLLLCCGVWGNLEHPSAHGAYQSVKNSLRGGAWTAR